MRTLMSLLGLGILLCGTARADSTPHWFKVKTEHFTVLTDANAKQARHIAGQLERMHSFFSALLPHASVDPGSQVVVLAFKNRKEMQAVEPSVYLAKNALDLAGLFMQEQDRSYILLRLDAAQEDHPYATLYHEYTHYMVRHSTILPIWLNEGMAQFFQNADIGDKSAQFGEADRNQILFLQQQRLLPLPTLFTVDYHSPFYHEEDKGSVFYAESWALTHYLRIQDYQNKTSRLSQYVTYLLQGEDPVKAGEHAFGDLKRLQDQLGSYIRQGSFSMFSMPLQTNINEAAFQVDPVPTSDVDAVRADVLVENGRTQEARTLLEAVLQQSPDNAQAHESMGLLELREGNLPEARTWYGQAVALHSSSYLAYYNYAALSLQSGDRDPAVGDDLRQATKLNPAFAPAYDTLAHFYAMQDQLDEAKSAILLAVELDPNSVIYRLNAAGIREQGRDFVNALSILTQAEAVARTDEEKDQVLLRLEEVKRMQLQTQEAEARSEASPARSVSGPVKSGREDQMTVRDEAGDELHAAIPASGGHVFPMGLSTGPRHTVRGIMHQVGCFYPKGLTLTVGGAGKSIPLYSNDMYTIPFTASNFTPSRDLNPCKEFEGMKASIVYAEVKDSTVAGQIVSVELTK